MSTDATHDPGLQSWVASANDPASDFPIQNLPFGAMRRAGESWRLGVAIGEQVLDLRAAIAEGLELDASLGLDSLNVFMAHGKPVRQQARATLSRALTQGSAKEAALRACLLPQAGIEMGLPCAIGADSPTSESHADARH